MSLIKSICILFCLAFLVSCSTPIEKLIPANIDHALALVDSTEVQGEMLKWIAIYADAPSYEHIVDSDEGATCVDDVGRFMEVIEFEINKGNRQDLLPLAEGLVKYLLHLSREDGLWYNFLFKDGSINKTHKNSVASFQWWAVRGLRGLGAGYRIFAHRPGYDSLSQRISTRFLASQPHLDSLFSSYPDLTLANDGSLRPTWNLSGAPDQSAELLTALAGVHGLGPFNYENEIKYLAEALIGWQYSGENPSYRGMYYCWQNTWHGWGSNQPLALLQAYIILEEEQYLNSVSRWADHFVPTLIEKNFPAEITLNSNGVDDIQDYSQIAYGLNSVYRGINLLAAITGSPEYAAEAEQVFGWFKGQNIAGVPMYNPKTGRCFDGINSAESVNHNSGAESTIECLLAIQARGGW
ncbi:MAG: hypothetical protein K9N29_08210 [Candidatus Marinimicrobia bacterium]|nr:hypothetical protein [Candidatus Neomarinimicrobiota bacterium]